MKRRLAGLALIVTGAFILAAVAIVRENRRYRPHYLT
jgi:hypothetical protein